MCTTKNSHLVVASHRIFNTDTVNFQTALSQRLYKRHQFGTGHAGYPKAQCAILMECASHAILDAELGAYFQNCTY